MRTIPAQIIAITLLVLASACAGMGILDYLDQRERAAADAELARIALSLRHAAERGLKPSCDHRCIYVGDRR